MAINTSRALAASGNASYTYTTHCFLVSFFLDCPQHWPELRCPEPELVKDFHDAVDAGWITWHAFPHNGEPETFDAELFADGIGLCHALDDRFGKPHASVLSQRDVPGLTRSVIPLLAQRDVLALSVRANAFRFMRSKSAPSTNTPDALLRKDSCRCVLESVFPRLSFELA